ncbi:hypothetical protein [Nocardioides convexus]|uniref:hypothetical protein n=1 Tax=Nocardioides convexus TaxID=2712224 RepID=UPI002418626C|nr:hypothetical protein [Nocardioides convexus]
MKLAILSRAPRSYSTQRLRTAALDRGHQVKVLNTLRFGIDLSGDLPDLQFRGKRLSDYDAVLPRIGNSITYFGTAVVRQFEQMDVYTPNTANGISNSRDKAARLADPLPAQHRHAGHHLRARPGRRDPRDRAGRRRTGRDQAAGGNPGHRGDPGAGHQGRRGDHRDPAEHQAAGAHPALRQGVARSRHPGPRRRRPGGRGDAPGRTGRRVPLQRPPRGQRRAGRAWTRSTSGSPSAPRRSWASRWPVSTCWRATRARWSWR